MIEFVVMYVGYCQIDVEISSSDDELGGKLYISLGIVHCLFYLLVHAEESVHASMHDAESTKEVQCGNEPNRWPFIFLRSAYFANRCLSMQEPTRLQFGNHMKKRGGLTRCDCVTDLSAARLSARRDRKFPIQNINGNGIETARNKWESRSTYFECNVFSLFCFGRCEFAMLYV